MTQKKRLPYSLQVGLAVCLGCMMGPFLGTEIADILGHLSGLPIKFLKALATPLVFVAITDAFCKTEIHLKSIRRLFAVSTLNACVAALIAFVLAPAFSLGRDVFNLTKLVAESEAETSLARHDGTTSPSVVKLLNEWVPHHIFEPFITNQVVSIVFLAILVGVALRKIKESPKTKDEFRILAKLVSGGLQLVLAILQVILKTIPFAVFGVVAKTVAIHGFDFLSSLGFFVGVVAFGLILHSIVYYSGLIFFVLKKSPLQFFKDAFDPLMTAFGTGSSLATLPVTLKTLQEKMKVSTESARLAACVGTNLNHNGILLYEVIAAFFIAEIHQIQLTGSQKLLIMGSSILSSIGIAGIPDAGLITLSIVLNSAGLPLTFVPLLMTVDWFIGRLRATSNVLSDILVANLLDGKTPSVQVTNKKYVVSGKDRVEPKFSRKEPGKVSVAL